MNKWKKAGMIIGTGMLLFFSGSAASGANVMLYHQEESIQENNIEGTMVSVSVEIPGNDTVAEAINESLTETINGPQQEVLQYLRDSAAEGVVYGPYSMESSLADYYSDDRVFSVKISSASYAGGVHGWVDFYTANYRLSDGAFLTFDSILTGSEARGQFANLLEEAWFESDLVQELLSVDAYSSEDMRSTARLAADYIDQDAWAFCPDGIKIDYPGGSYLFYAAGPFDVVIPYERLHGVVQENYLPGTNGTAQDTSSGSFQDSASPRNEASPTAVLNTYQLIRTDLSWEKASEDARQRGGHLAVITSQEEQAEVEKLLQNSDVHTVWLGGQRSQGSFAWVTGEAFSWKNWAKGEPNNETGDENYLDMYKNSEDKWGWNDVPGDIAQYYSGRMGYILEIEMASLGQ